MEIGREEKIRKIWIETIDEDTGEVIKKKLNIINISLNFLDCYRIITVGDEKYDIYCYNKKEGIYKKNAEIIINQYCQRQTEGEITKYHLSEIRGQIERQTHKDRNILINKNINLVCVGNGILDINTMELKPHTPDEIFTDKIEWEYLPECDCQLIKEFLNQILDSEDVKVLQEFVGYCLYRRYFIKKALIFHGGKNTGKTTTINLVVKFIGQSNTSGVSLHKIIYDKFSGYRLYNKLLNFYDDLSFKDIKDTGSFKISTGGGYISAEKKFGDSFEFMNYAKLLFATNKFSAVVDTDDLAYYERWVILPFETTFDENNESTDKKILDKITTNEEMSGMLNWALEGLKNILKTEKFSYKKTADDNRIIMEKNSNSIVAFIYEILSNQEDKFVAINDLYEMYCHYVNENKLPKETEDKFAKTLPKKIPYAVACRRDCTKNGKEMKNTRGYLNIGIPTMYTTFLHIYMNKKKDNSIFNIYNSRKGGIHGSKNPHPSTTMDSKQVKDTLISLFAVETEIEINQFLTRFPDNFYSAIEIMLDNMKRDGVIFETKPGFIKLL